jgi:hypothetical protein
MDMERKPGTQDREDFAIYKVLRDHLAKSSEGNEPIVPLVRKADGHIDLEKTIDLPCYAALKEEIGQGIDEFCKALLKVGT